MQEQKDNKNLIEQGFTLIELLVVIAILGILAAVVVFSVNGITDRGKTSACSTEVSTIQTAVEAYDAKNGSYPASLGVTAQNAIDALNGSVGVAPNKFLNSALTLTSPSIAAGYRYAAAGNFTGGTC